MMQHVGPRFARLLHATRTPLARSAAWSFAGQGAGLALQAATFVLLARLMGSSEYGILIGATAFVAIAGQFATLGSGMVLLRHVSRQRRTFALYWGNALVSLSASGSLALVVLPLLGGRLLSASSASLLLLATLGEFFGTRLLECAGQAFQAFEDLRPASLLGALAHLLRLIAAAALLATAGTISAQHWLFIATAISLSVAAAAVALAWHRLGAPALSTMLLRRRALEGFGFSIASSSTSIYNDIDKSLLSHFGLNRANGAYSLAYRAVDMATMPVRAVHAAALPRFFRLRAQGRAALRGFATRLLRRTVPLAALAALLAFLAAPLLPALAGASFRESVPALRWLCLLPLLRSLHLAAGDCLTAAGLQTRRTAFQLTAAAANCALNLWLIPVHGWLGAAWASLATDGLLAALNWMSVLLSFRSSAHPSTTFVRASTAST